MFLAARAVGDKIVRGPARRRSPRRDTFRNVMTHVVAEQKTDGSSLMEDRSAAG